MAHNRRRVKCRQEHKTWIQRVGIAGIVVFVIALGLATMDSRARSNEMKVVKNCTRMNILAKAIDQGIIPPPQATPEQIAATDLANARMRQLLQTVIEEADC